MKGRFTCKTAQEQHSVPHEGARPAERNGSALSRLPSAPFSVGRSLPRAPLIMAEPPHPQARSLRFIGRYQTLKHVLRRPLSFSLLISEMGMMIITPQSDLTRIYWGLGMQWGANTYSHPYRIWSSLSTSPTILPNPSATLPPAPQADREQVLSRGGESSFVVSGR